MKINVTLFVFLLLMYSACWGVRPVNQDLPSQQKDEMQIQNTEISDMYCKEKTLSETSLKSIKACSDCLKTDEGAYYSMGIACGVEALLCALGL